jgi:very-short-patch-repair endonuclease
VSLEAWERAREAGGEPGEGEKEPGQGEEEEPGEGEEEDDLGEVEPGRGFSGEGVFGEPGEGEEEFRGVEPGRGFSGEGVFGEPGEGEEEARGVQPGQDQGELGEAGPGESFPGEEDFGEPKDSVEPLGPEAAPQPRQRSEGAERRGPRAGPGAKKSAAAEGKATGAGRARIRRPAVEREGPGGWPAEGEPHPRSPGEALLFEALGQDPELRGLFVFNKTLQVLGRSIAVDLWWPEGALAVEVDGYRYHGDYKSFARDRHRDFMVLATGGRVLRLTAREVMEDVRAALDKIRLVVEAISK